MSIILIVDDDKALCRSLELQLQAQGHTVSTAHSKADGEVLLRDKAADMALLDLTLPDGSGLDILRQALVDRPGLDIVMITGKQDMKATIEAVRIGAFDYIRKPFEFDDILLAIAKSERAQKRTSTPLGTGETTRTITPYEIIGADKAIIEIIKQIGLLSKTNVTTLITGESGTGKELVARALHEAGAGGKPFIALNCSAVVPTLLESELFGHEKGAFTGADVRRLGKLELAAEGTLFLDEIGDMPLDLQAKVLRVLQEKEFERVGGNEGIPFRARVIAATHCDLLTMIEAGTFREDLYFRLAVSPLHVPALRERRGDIQLLIGHLLESICRELHSPAKSLDETALKRLVNYNWPGNIRELVNSLTRAIALSHGTVLAEDDFAFLFAASQATGDSVVTVSLRQAEKEHIERTLSATGWNITQSARLLEISPTTLRKKIADYKLR